MRETNHNYENTFSAPIELFTLILKTYSSLFKYVMFETELFHINDVFIASFVLVHNSIFYTTSDMKGNGQIKACRLNETR